MHVHVQEKGCSVPYIVSKIWDGGRQAHERRPDTTWSYSNRRGWSRRPLLVERLAGGVLLCRRHRQAGVARWDPRPQGRMDAMAAMARSLGTEDPGSVPERQVVPRFRHE